MKHLALAILVSLSFSAFAQESVDVGENTGSTQNCIDQAESIQCESCKQKCPGVNRDQTSGDRTKKKQQDSGTSGSQAVSH